MRYIPWLISYLSTLLALIGVVGWMFLEPQVSLWLDVIRVSMLFLMLIQFGCLHFLTIQEGYMPRRGGNGNK